MKRSRQLGAAAVEFALLLPVLALILFGIIEFGLLLYDQQVITNASREGARAGIVEAATRARIADITAVVTDYTGSYLMTFAPGTVNPSVTAPGGACTAFGRAWRSTSPISNVPGAQNFRVHRSSSDRQHDHEVRVE